MLPGGAAVEPEPGPVGSAELPQTTATTEQNINDLITDSNVDFPLTRVNAQRVLSYGGATAETKVAGPGGEGADVTNTTRTPEGVLRSRIEVKSIVGGAQSSFNRDVGEAARQLGYNGRIFVQMPAGTDALRTVLRFRGARLRSSGEAAALGRYRSVTITIVDPSGNVLWEGPLAP